MKRFAISLVLVSTLIWVANAAGQCGFVPGTQPASSTMNNFLYVAYTLTGIPGCVPSLGMGMNTGNGAYCFGQLTVPPGSYNCPTAGGMNCAGLLARLPITTGGMATNTGPHTCSWNCGACGTLVLNNGNGLPVELMDFSIESNGEGNEVANPDDDPHLEP